MCDVFSKQKRSEVMAAIRSKGNKETEQVFAAILRKNGINGWRRHLSIEGKPDFAFPKERVTVFIDGCFWHGCPKHGRNPSSNQDYWRRKLSQNRARDRRVSRRLRTEGWHVLRFWEHDLRHESTVLKKLRKLV
jgi:DNA mismatch endonuclease, patch repair protein